MVHASKEKVDDAREDGSPNISMQYWHGSWLNVAAQARANHHIGTVVVEGCQ
jgi:hypothetical protein